MAFYELVIRMAAHQGDACSQILAAQGCQPDGAGGWRLGALQVVLSNGQGQHHCTVRIPLLEAEPPAELALSLAFRLAEALASEVFDPQLGRVVRATDTDEIIEQVAAHWEPPVEEPGRMARAIAAMAQQSTTSMVLVVVLAALASFGAVVSVDIPEQHTSNALFAGLLAFGFLFSVLRFLIARALQGKRQPDNR